MRENEHRVVSCPMCASERLTTKQSSTGEYFVCKDCGLNFWSSTKSPHSFAHLGYSYDTHKKSTEAYAETCEPYAYKSAKAPSFLNNEIRSCLTVIGFGILLLNLLAAGLLMEMPVRGLLYGIIFFIGILVLGVMGSVLVAGLYGYDFSEGSFCTFNAWLGLWSGVIVSIFFSCISLAVLSSYPLVLCVETFAVSTLFFYLAIWNYNRDSWLAHASDFICQGDILNNKGDLYGAIRSYVKSALIAHSHTRSKVSQVSIQRYSDLTLTLLALSILGSSAEKSANFLTKCQKKLERTNAYKQITSEVDNLIETLANGNRETVFSMFLETDAAQVLLDFLQRTGEIKLSNMSAEHKYDEKMLQVLLETAVTNGKLQGFLTNDKKTFMTKDHLMQKLSAKLSDKDG